MGIVSYAQNFEDVMLWRALKDVKNGFYIDIGANDPIKDSVTKAFYENGWHGINIEPELELYELLKEERERDINLNLAINSKIDSVEFYVSKIRGWSTTDKNSMENLEEKDSFLEKRIVKAISLDTLCEEHNVGTVHFLKIDVEGAEKDVLQSFSFNKTRPWICVIEATKPTTQIDISDEWENIILEHDYIYAYFDGLNKYYIAKENEALLQYFNAPPNVFDEFTLHLTVEANQKTHEWLRKATQAEAKASEAEAKASEAEAKANEAEAKANEAEAKANEAEAKANEAEAKATQAQEKATQAQEKASEAEARANEALHHYHMVLNSNSWKLTKPYRILGQKYKWFKGNVKAWLTFAPSSRPRKTLKKLLLTVKYKLNSHPKIKNKLLRILDRYPALKKKIMHIGKDNSLNNQPMRHTSYSNPAVNLSPQAKKIYNDLKKEIEMQKRGK